MPKIINKTENRWCQSQNCSTRIVWTSLLDLFVIVISVIQLEKKQENRWVLSQFNDFDQDVIIGDDLSSERQSAVVNSTPTDCEYTANENVSNRTKNQNTVNVQTLKRCRTDKHHRATDALLETVEGRIQSAFLTIFDNFFTTRIELAVRSINESSGQDATFVAGNSERAEHMCPITSSEKCIP